MALEKILISLDDMPSCPCTFRILILASLLEKS